MADGLNRLFLWGTPRGLTTAVIKCLSHVDGIQIVNQPYATAHYCGPDSELPKPNSSDKLVSNALQVVRLMKEGSKTVRTGPEHSLMSYKWVRDELLQAPYPNKKILLCREQAHYLHGNYDSLPQGFKHSFIIRHPIKMFSSYREFLTKAWGDFPDMCALPPLIFPPGCSFKELYDLVEYVKGNIDQQPVIMDADDLLEDPAGILSTYCARMGIPYSDELLCWEAGGDIATTWITSKATKAAIKIIGFHDRAFESVRFDSPSPIPDLTSLPMDVQECVRFSMGYYESLRRGRIKAK